MQQSCLGVLARAQQLGDCECIPPIILGAVQLVSLSMFLDRVRIHQPIADLVLLQVCGQQLPIVVRGFHPHQHGRGLVLFLQLAQPAAKILVAASIIVKAKSCQLLCSFLQHHDDVAIQRKIYSNIQRARLDTCQSL